MVPFLLAGVVVVAVIWMYNGLVGLQVRAENAWSDIDVQLKRRHDLVPNVVEAVKGYARHERGTLESVVAARTRAVAADGPAARGRAERGLTEALRSLFALAESYPELRAAEGFRDLQRTLSELEDDIADARRYYNAVVRDYNTRLRQLPTNVVARVFGFGPREFFEADADERDAPEVRV